MARYNRTDLIVDWKCSYNWWHGHCVSCNAGVPSYCTVFESFETQQRHDLNVYWHSVVTSCLYFVECQTWKNSIPTNNNKQNKQQHTHTLTSKKKGRNCKNKQRQEYWAQAFRYHFNLLLLYVFDSNQSSYKELFSEQKGNITHKGCKRLKQDWFNYVWSKKGVNIIKHTLV